jgi:predicted transcriptional regulator
MKSFLPFLYIRFKFWTGLNLGNYRSKLDIIADILLVVKRGNAKKTQIMYGANLSYTVLTRYLTEVVKACLIRFESGKRCYVLTNKGKEFLERYREYSKRNKHVVRQINDIEAKRKFLEELCSA